MAWHRLDWPHLQILDPDQAPLWLRDVDDHNVAGAGKMRANCQGHVGQKEGFSLSALGLVDEDETSEIRRFQTRLSAHMPARLAQSLGD